MTTDKTYTNQELVDRIEKATRDKDKLQRVGGNLAETEGKPICHYINGTKLYTKGYVEELERRLEIAKEALEFYENCTRLMLDVKNLPIDPILGSPFLSSKSVMDNGDTARAALEKIKAST
jgi:hypothetical protein